MKIETAIGEFIKWTFKDKDGEFSDVGQVTAFDDKKVTFRCAFGTNTIPWTDGTFTKSKVVALPERKVVVEPVVEAPVQVKPAHQPKAGSKLESAHILYKNATDKSRSVIIDLFQKELSMTPAGAQTYYYLCKKG